MSKKQRLLNSVQGLIQDMTEQRRYNARLSESRAYSQQQEQERWDHAALNEQNKAIAEQQQKESSVNAGLEYLKPNKFNPNAQFQSGVNIGNLTPQTKPNLSGLAINGLLQDAPQSRLTESAYIPKTVEERNREWFNLDPKIQNDVTELTKTSKPDFKYDYNPNLKYAEKVYDNGLREPSDIVNKTYQKRVSSQSYESPTGRQTKETWEVFDPNKNDFVKQDRVVQTTVINKDKGVEENTKEYQSNLNKQDAETSEAYAKYYASGKKELPNIEYVSAGQDENGNPTYRAVNKPITQKIAGERLNAQKQIAREKVKQGLSENAVKWYNTFIDDMKNESGVDWNQTKAQYVNDLKQNLENGVITPNDYKNLIQSAHLTEFGVRYSGKK